MEYRNKIALVTGAGQGIGKGIALGLAREGADIVVNDVSLRLAEATVIEIRGMGVKSIAIQANVADEKEVEGMMARVVSDWGGIDILVNNAGIGNARMVEDMTESEWHNVIGVNLDGTFYCSKAVLETMKSRGGGRIVNISSLAGKKISIGSCAAYTASKSGILGFTRHLAFEVGPYKINVNAICPGLTLTDKVQMPTERLKSMTDSMPLKDACRPQDIANTALFLASDQSKMITGITIDVDAGESVVSQDWEGYVKRRKEAFAKGEPPH